MTLYYLATPYSKFPGGLDAAFRVACEASALLIRAGVPVFSPIAHSHPIAMHGGIDPLSHDIWLPADRPMMNAASGLIMLTAESWQDSYWMRVQLETFRQAGKPVHWMTPGAVPADLLHTIPDPRAQFDAARRAMLDAYAALNVCTLEATLIAETTRLAMRDALRGDAP